ncbi:hypothetical protein (plasmid) [Acinetobacter baumannii]|uniref:Uncharacterized protein n=1 Tax=Acinetobacter baumannii TaxID=470 RepID=A0A0C4Y2V9_ACIBA|nr:hypothetical protein [Acinetobacter baumannii]AJF79929.1 hypothetical protein NG19_0093 [Acinetobacter baumannii]QZX59141.1 hypothetical protein [Acinetobacter baumannii]QZX59251.1 hypothetical protein [Acinetobacter baumannii]QZX59640.1 hypothetical protein [Acinetobacter baumannii]QZX59760.1 hypothetical protein [Acinetobacter baumannii]
MFPGKSSIDIFIYTEAKFATAIDVFIYDGHSYKALVPDYIDASIYGSCSAWNG